MATRGLLRRVVWLGPADEIDPPYHAWHLPEALLWTLVLLLLLLAPLRLKPLFSNPLFKWLGVLSYSIYILHIPVIQYSLAVAWRWFPPPGWGWNGETLPTALLIGALCVGLAGVTYMTIERPFLRRKEALRV